ncbi:MAG: hypothetical protein EKK64_10320 [Neisseriaceae bacterium]|nr:MAG: hypothetical protein EKK64_10320 [Neisseriaceae bacterium]
MSRILDLLENAEKKKKDFLDEVERKKKEDYDSNANYLNLAKEFFLKFEEEIKSKLQGTNVGLVPVVVTSAALESRPDMFAISCIWQVDLKDFDSITIRAEDYYNYEDGTRIFSFSDSFFKGKNFKITKNFSNFELGEINESGEISFKNVSLQEFVEEFLVYYIENATNNYIKKITS